MMTRVWMFFAIAAAGACGSGGGGGAAPEPEAQVHISRQGGTRVVELHHETNIAGRTIGAPLDSVWAALPRIYEILGVPDVGGDPRLRLFGNPAFRVRRVEGNRLSTYVDCGMGPTAVPKADEYEVTLSLLTRLKPAGSGATVMETTLSATAKPRARSGDPVYCQTTGALEARVGELMAGVFPGP